MNPRKISAVVPTRGDHDLRDTVIASLCEFAEVIVWDNSVERDLKVYGRYEAIERASMPVIYTQDDDCIVASEQVCAHYMPGILVVNMPHSRWSDYPDSALVGWGSVFDSEMPRRVFDKWEERYGTCAPSADVFARECDVIFSTLVPHLKIDVGFSHLPWAEKPGRMFTGEYNHRARDREQMLTLARRVRGWP